MAMDDAIARLGDSPRRPTPDATRWGGGGVGRPNPIKPLRSRNLLPFSGLRLRFVFRGAANGDGTSLRRGRWLGGIKKRMVAKKIETHEFCPKTVEFWSRKCKSLLQLFTHIQVAYVYTLLIHVHLL
jgi:hypothetical protein